MVPVVRLELTRSCEQRILSPWRLPIPPYWHLVATYLCTDGVANHPLGLSPNTYIIPQNLRFVKYFK